MLSMKVFIMLLTMSVVLVPIHAQEPAAVPKSKGKGKGKAPAARQPQFLAPLSQRVSSSDAKLHRDFPDFVIGPDLRMWSLFIEHDGTADMLQLATREQGGWKTVTAMSKPGVIHQPAITTDGKGGVWCFWGQVNDRDVMTLRARRFTNNKTEDELELAAFPDAGSTFADAGMDAAGRVWVTWQEVRPGKSQVWTRHWSRDGWSKSMQVSSQPEGGNWEPRIAFSDTAGAWIVYDSSEGSEFNLRLARVTPDGGVEDKMLVQTSDYEARASIASDGKGGLWITAERGRRQWGLDSRGHENAMGLNAQKRLLLGRYDIANGQFTEVPVPDNGRPTPAPDPSPGFAVNIPSVAVREDGQVWLSYRYFANTFWRAAITRYDPATRRWAEPAAIPDSTMGQDRHQELHVGPKGGVWITWATDKRTTKASGVAEIHSALLKHDAEWPLLPEEPEAGVARATEPEPYFNEPSPPRPLSDHHTWKIGGRTYRLLWGDLHRHTDISNCRTGFDGCINEHYRYAYDLAGLDFLGTSDHTDIGKIYSTYEWWHTQRQVDAFHAPGSFASLYAYEREQTFPWGHRNIVFARRGGPIVYIQRQNYRESIWQEKLPVSPGLMQILPFELWDILKRYNQPVAIISHTGATGMGTDWTQYADGIDNTHENTVEIFQGARVSYEGIGTPQPTVGLRKDEPYTPHKLAGNEHPMPPGVITDFDAGFKKPQGYNNGVYQKALEAGHKLGVFASSDHIATHTSFGGVYVEEFSREGIIDGFKARRTCAATDKIFVELSCGTHLMGEVFAVDGKPSLTFHVNGTAPVRRLTIVRNEQNHHVLEPNQASLSGAWTDEEPLKGENRYYLRIEQSDGNMAWSSPLWVTVP